MSLVQVINELRNLFLDDSDELPARDKRNVLYEPVVNTVRTVHSLGKDQNAKYCKQVIIGRTSFIHMPGVGLMVRLVGWGS